MLNKNFNQLNEMNKNIIKGFFSFLLVILTPTAYCQAWEEFNAMFEGTPGTINVNVLLHREAPNSKQPFLVKTAVKMVKPDKYGLASQEEMPMFKAFSNSVELLLGQKRPYSYAGIFTHEGVRLNYFYVPDTVGLRQKFVSMYAKDYPNSTLGLTFEYEPKWNTYFNFLYPGDELIKKIRESKKKK